MGELPARLRTFLRELKRRRVVQVAMVYAGVAFLVLQAADVIFPMLLLPAWLSRAVLALVLLGFPIAMVLAWAFDMTPEGLERVEDRGPTGPGAADAGGAAGGPAREGAWLSLPSALTVGVLVLVGVGLGWFIGGAELAGGAGGGAGAGARGGIGPYAPSGAPLVHLSVNLANGDSVYGAGAHVALSPDGSRLVWAARRRDTARLYIRPLNQTDAEPVAGTEGARSPFFSPDGEWIGFFADGMIKKVPSRGGTPVEIAEFNFVGGSWGPDDTIVVGQLAPGPGRGLWRVPAGGGELERLTTSNSFDLEHPEQAHLWPDVLPDGRGVLFTSWNNFRDMWVSVLDLRTGERRILLEPGTNARYVPTGHLVYAWDGNLLVAPFDLENLQVTGPSVAVGGDVAVGRWGDAAFAVSTSGTLARVPGETRKSSGQLVRVDRSGAVEELPFGPGNFGGVRISPDGSRFVATRTEDRVRVFVFDPSRGTAQRLTGQEPTEFWPIWSPDGRFVVHNSNRYGGPALNLYRTPIDGGEAPERLTTGEYHQQPQSWSPDGATLIYTVANDPETGFDIWAVDVEGEREPRPVLRTPADEFQPSLSPDGRWLAYTSNRSGQWEVFLRRFPGPGGTVQVTPAGGEEPVWASDGHRLYYRDVSGDTVWSVTFAEPPESEPFEPELGTPELVVTGAFEPGWQPGRRYDLAPQGERFLMIQEGGPAQPWINRTRIDLTLNWFQELERLVERRRR